MITLLVFPELVGPEGHRTVKNLKSHSLSGLNTQNGINTLSQKVESAHKVYGRFRRRLATHGKMM